MSIEAKTDEPIVVRASNDAVIAMPRIAIPTWRRRRYQVAAALIAVVVIAAFFVNNFLVRQYSPEGAVRQYLGALQSGDSSTARRLIQVTSGDGAAVKLTDRSALEAALANGRPDIKSFAITGTTPVNGSTSAVTFTYETSGGAKDARFLVKRSAQNNLQIYPGWQLVVTPVDLQVSLPAGSGGVVIDGKPVAIDGKSVVAVLPLAHQVRFPGTRMVEAKTVAVDAFASQGAAVS
jgi:hypothetical protein